MATITIKDGTQIYFKDWGTGQPVVFSHGWPLSADAWEDQMCFWPSRGYRCIAHDRRGHGRSSQPWNGNEMDTYADDLAALVEALDLKDAIHVGHSTGGGEVARYIGRHGTKRVSKAVLISAVPAAHAQNAGESRRPAHGSFDQLRAAVQADRSQFFKDLSAPFYGANRTGAKVSARLAGFFLAARHAVRNQSRLRLHQSFFRNGFHRRPQKVRRANAYSSRRRRPDRAHRRLGPAFFQDRQGRHAESHSGRAARHVLHAQRSNQRGTAGVPAAQPASVGVKRSKMPSSKI